MLPSSVGEGRLPYQRHLVAAWTSLEAMLEDGPVTRRFRVFLGPVKALTDFRAYDHYSSRARECVFQNNKMMPPQSVENVSA
jgi:hypothetical protein